jgi:hypothetical protein
MFDRRERLWLVSAHRNRVSECAADSVVKKNVAMHSSTYKLIVTSNV